MLERRPRLLDRLVQGDAEPALGDEQVGHRGRPGSAADLTDRQRVGQRPAGDDRVGDGVAFALEIAQGGPHRPELLDRADAFEAPGGVRGPAGHPQPEGQRAGRGRHQVQAGRLGDHAGVGSPAAVEQREGARARRPPRPARRRGAGRRAAESRCGAGRPAPSTTRRDRPSCRRLRGRAGCRRRPRPRTAGCRPRCPDSRPGRRRRGRSASATAPASRRTPSSLPAHRPTSPHDSARSTSTPGKSTRSVSSASGSCQWSTSRPSAASCGARAAWRSFSSGVPPTLGQRTSSASQGTSSSARSSTAATTSSRSAIR